MKTVDKKQVKHAKQAIAEMQLRQLKNINRGFSAYRLKHTIEDHLMLDANGNHTYISEQACIKAMIKLGFNTHVDKHNRTYFNVGMYEINQSFRRTGRSIDNSI